MKKAKLLSISNVILFIGVLIVNAAANALPINGYNTGELSDMYPNLFVPAGITFSIWGVIYILLAIFSIYSLILVFKGSETNRIYYNGFGLYFAFSSIGNIAWIFLWHYKLLALSVLAMLLILVSLIFTYIRIQGSTHNLPKAKLLLLKIPISIYLGWICVATIANITAFLADRGWNGFGISEVVWTVVVITVAAVLGIAFIIKNNDIFYPLVVIWAFIGIIIKRNAVAIEAEQPIVFASYLMIAILAVGILYKIRKKEIYD
jgi:hypothetical protein